MTAYLLDVSLCWLIFYLLYYCWLSKETFFQLNRWYLLGTLLLGLIIPVIPSPFGAGVQESNWVTLYVAPINMGLESLEVTVTAPSKGEMDIDWQALLKWIYWAGVCFTGIRFLSGLSRIAGMYLRAEHIRVGQYHVALTDEQHLPFSFFRVVFKSKLGKLNEFEDEKITDHELAHVRGWHTIDVLLVELVSIFLWCSPPVHLYRRSLRIVHEYIADSAAIRTGQKKKYGHLLIRQSQSGLQLALANHFIQSQLKKRIMMMTRTRSRRQAFLKYLPVIPLLVAALVVFSNWEAVAGDSMDRLKDKSVEAVETLGMELTNDYDPRVLRKQLSAALHKLDQLEAGENGNKNSSFLLQKFVAIHEKWSGEFPGHQQEIKLIAEKVAAEYDVELEFNNNAIKTARLKSRSVIYAPGMDLGTPPIEGIKFKPQGDPYVLIDDKPAPADWKSTLDKNDIESIDVLKGESATEVYGAKAKDGAIRIYTKSFKKTGTILPRFPGCEDIEDPKERDECANVNLREHLFANLKYPEDYSKYDVQGTVIAKYTVDKTGQIKDVHIVRTIGGGFSKAVEDVLESMPKLIPGTVDGVPADVEVTLPIQFKASGKEVKESSNTPDPMVIISSLNHGKDKPLYVIDGKIQNKGYVIDLDPNDIEIIDVLKGEQAVKAYGDQGANGVVRIFTKERLYDIAPVFPGCEALEGTEQLECSKEGFLRNVYMNIKYPASARNSNIEGLIVVKYTIGKDGKVKDPIIHRGIDGALDQEVLRVINELPDWEPALKGGKPVAMDMILPIQFRIENEQKSNAEKIAGLAGDRQQEKSAFTDKDRIQGEVVDQIVVTGYGNASENRDGMLIVEDMPRFPGCEDESDETRMLCAQKRMLEFVYNNISYPKAAKQAGTSGTVLASFVVGKTGEIRDVKIEKGLGHGLNEQVLEVISKMPKWIPGRQKGKAVDAIVHLPVKFKLDSQQDKKPTEVHVNGPEPGSDLRRLELQNFRAAPNPSHGLINLRFQSEAKPLNLRILSADGQIVYQRELPRFSGNFDEQIDLQDAPKGTLFISIQQGEQVHTSTVILQ